MTTLNREWLLKRISELEDAGDEIPFGLDEDGNNTLEALKLALASLDAEPVGVVEPGDYVTAAQLVGEEPRSKSVRPTFEGSLVIGQKLYTAPPAPVVPEEVMPGGLVYSSALPRFESNDSDKVVGYCCFISGETRSVESQGQAYADAKVVVNACRAAMLQGGKS